jgi:peptidoglycan DL-endopeptidase CwlO
MQAQGKLSIVTYTEFILSSNDLSQLLTRSAAVMEILETNTDIMKALSKKEETLKGAEQKLENELAQLKKSQDDLASEQKKIEADKEEMNKVFTDSKDILKQQQTQLAKQQTQKYAEDKARQEAQERAREEEAPAPAPAPENEKEQKQAPERPRQQEQESSANDRPIADTQRDEATNSDKANELIAFAKQYLGVKYVWGGTSPSGFDCSGFTQYVFRSVGINLPRVSRVQQDFGTQISPYNVKKGDLIFRGNPARHVGIYIGDGKYIHSPQMGDVVKISTYNPSKTTSATRVLH